MVIYFKSVSNDFRPLSRNVYIAECLEWGLSAQTAEKQAGVRLSFISKPARIDFYWQFARFDEMAKGTWNIEKIVINQAI